MHDSHAVRILYFAMYKALDVCIRTKKEYVRRAEYEMK
jgi:hypothetical protein